MEEVYDFDRPRLIIVANYAAYYSGNFIASLTALEKKVVINGVCVEYVFPENAPFSNWGEDGRFSENHVIHTTDFKPRNLSRALKKIIHSDEPTSNIIIYMHFLDFKAIHVITRALKSYGCKFIVQEHMRVDFGRDNRDRDCKRKVKDFVKRILYKNAITGCRVIGVSDAVYRDLCAIRGDNKWIYMVRNAISTGRLDGTGHWDNVLRLEPQHDVVIFGTHFERKGVDIALQAVMKSGHSLRLVVLTHHEEDTIKKLDEINLKWKKYAVVYHVVEEIPCVYNHCLCFVSPSRSEAFGYAVAEAAYCDTQVIATDIPGQNSMKCIPGIIWVSPDNTDELANALVQCYKKRRNCYEKIEKQNATQRLYIVDKFGLDQWSDEIMKICELQKTTI